MFLVLKGRRSGSVAYGVLVKEWQELVVHICVVIWVVGWVCGCVGGCMVGAVSNCYRKAGGRGLNGYDFHHLITGVNTICSVK